MATSTSSNPTAAATGGGYPTTMKRNTSRSRSRERTNIPSRPTTPLRPPSRTSLRASQTTPSNNAPFGGQSTSNASGGGGYYNNNSNSTNNSGSEALAALEPAFAELSDSMADLEANFMHLQLLNESLARFNENFGSFLYGMNMSAFCVDFPEAPIPYSFTNHHRQQRDSDPTSPSRAGAGDHDATFLTTDTSFVENPPTSIVRPASKFPATPSSSSTTTSRATRGSGLPVGRGAAATGGGGRAGRASGIARGSYNSSAGSRGGSSSTTGRGRGTRGSSSGGGVARGRGGMTR